ncbi:BACON domain-containing protein [Prevotella sp.]|uniref:BACON domain-containing protein n=1 Tax=Prevotella sp. TaxID=59823 RepID=UPI002F91E552
MSKKSLMMAFTCFVTLLSGLSSCTTEDKADEALPRLQVSQARYEVTLPGTLKDRSIPEMRVIANKGYQISSDQPWLKVDKTEGIGFTDVKILCDSNLTETVREGNLTVNSHGLSENIHVTQTLFDPGKVTVMRTFYEDNFDWTLPIAAENGLKDPIGANNGYTRMSITDSKVLEAWKACGLTDWYLATVNSSGVCKISIQMGYIHFNSNSNFNTGIILPPIEGTQNNSETVNATLSFRLCPDSSTPDYVPAVVEIIAGPGSLAADKDQPMSDIVVPKFVKQWENYSFNLYGITADTKIAIHTVAPNTQKYCRWYIDDLLLKEFK